MGSTMQHILMVKNIIIKHLIFTEPLMFMIMLIVLII